MSYEDVITRIDKLEDDLMNRLGAIDKSLEAKDDQIERLIDQSSSWSNILGILALIIGIIAIFVTILTVQTDDTVTSDLNKITSER